MSTTIESFPITKRVEPTSIDELVSAVNDAVANDFAIYPLGGCTSLDFGPTPQREGIGLSLAGLHRVVDYPSRDMTITVEAGITMQSLAERLSAERQRVPVDAARSAEATAGGVVATNWFGPRCYGMGSVRDYLIGVQAVTAQGERFKAGGRVVKNVAGYDLCKLLTGSLGTLAIITELTFKLKPVAEASLLLACRPESYRQADELLAALVQSETTPVAIELLAGPAWRNRAVATDLGHTDGENELLLVVGLEGTMVEATWMEQQLATEWRALGIRDIRTIDGGEAERFWQQLVEFPQADDYALALQVCVVPSATLRIVEALQSIDANCHIQAHAGNGVILACFDEFPAAGLSRTLVSRLRPAASAAEGSVVVLSNPSGVEMTRHGVWGSLDSPLALMQSIKRQFDPDDRLNPGRFVY